MATGELKASAEAFAAAPAQPEQLSLWRGPEWEQELVEFVRGNRFSPAEKKFVFTGRILSKDQELCREICVDILRGLSTRGVARKYHVSPNSVSVIVSIMRERGELEALEKTAVRLLDRAIVLGLEAWCEGLERGTISPAQTPIPTAVMIDKRALLTGGATARVETRSAAPTREQLLASLDQLRSLAIDVPSEVVPALGAGGGAESRSDALSAESPPIATPAARDPSPDPSPAHGTGSPAGPGHGPPTEHGALALPAPSAGLAPGPAPGAKGGEGVGSPGGGAETDGSPPENSTT